MFLREINFTGYDELDEDGDDLEDEYDDNDMEELDYDEQEY